MNYLLILTTFLLALPTWSAAQSRTFVCPSNARSLDRIAAEKLLGRVQTTYQSVSALRASFSQESFVAALDESEHSQGEVIFQKPGKMKWHYRKPTEQVFITKNQTLWLYQPEQGQVLIDSLQDALISDLPVAFLMGIGNLSKDFTAVSACEHTDGVVLTLAPKSTEKKSADQKELQTFKLLVHPTLFQVRGAQITDVGGNETSILLLSPTINLPMVENEFSTDFPKGIDIQDHRTSGAAAHG